MNLPEGARHDKTELKLNDTVRNITAGGHWQYARVEAIHVYESGIPNYYQDVLTLRKLEDVGGMELKPMHVMIYMVPAHDVRYAERQEFNKE